MADSNIQTPDTVKPITLDEYNERTAHLQENTTSLLSTIADRQVQAAGLATQAYSLASEVNAVAEQASLSFSKKTWEDNATSGTPITAAELNRLENAISNLTTAVNNLQDSVSPMVLYYDDLWLIASFGMLGISIAKNVKVTGSGWTLKDCPYILPLDKRPKKEIQAPGYAYPNANTRIIVDGETGKIRIGSGDNFNLDSIVSGCIVWMVGV